MTVLDKLTYAGNPANLDEVRSHPGFAFVQGDICDAALVDKLHARARPGRPLRRRIPCRPFDRRRRGLRAHQRARHPDPARRRPAPRHRHLRAHLHRRGLRLHRRRLVARDAPARPNSPYSASKASSDLLALAYHRTHGLDVRVTRCSNNYGPHHFPEKVIPLFVTNLLDGEKVPLYGDGANVRDWLHVDDHCQGIELVRTKGPPRRGLQHRRRHRTDQQGADAAAPGRVRRRLGPVEHVADRKGHDRRYSVDCAKIRADSATPPQQGLHRRPGRDRRTGTRTTATGGSPSRNAPHGDSG